MIVYRGWICERHSVTESDYIRTLDAAHEQLGDLQMLADDIYC